MNENYYLEDLIRRYPALECQKENILDCYSIMKDSYLNRGKILLAGNGGSAADCEHIAGELMKGFVNSRELDAVFLDKLKQIDPIHGEKIGGSLQKGLAAIPLVNLCALNTAVLNDNGGDYCFAQPLYALGKKEDVLCAISTSGNSYNVYLACIVAKAIGMKVILLSGRDGGMIAGVADKAVIVPEKETYRIQELHLPIYHTLCLMLEDYFFGGK